MDFKPLSSLSPLLSLKKRPASEEHMEALVTTVYWARRNESRWTKMWKRRYIQLAPEHWENFEMAASNKSIRSDDGHARGPHSAWPGKGEAQVRPMSEHVAYWWRHTEFVQPSVKTFHSFSHLMRVLHFMDPEAPRS